MKNITIAILAIILSGCGIKPSPHLSDDVMIGHFQEHQESFSQLLQLFVKSGKTEVRLGEDLKFDALMEEVSVNYIHVRMNDFTHVEFIVSTTGMATGGTSKGYVWSQGPKKPIVENLDEYKKDHRNFVAYRKLSEHWYIRYEHDG